MNSITAKPRSPLRWGHVIAAGLPRSIVARTTLLIIGLAILVGMAAAAGGAWMIHRSEARRLHAQLEELLATVESTVSIACYVKDSALAEEIAKGLMHNRAIRAVRLSADGAILGQQSRAGSPAADAPGMLTITRQVHSPFKPSEVVGEISLYAADADIQAQAWVYTRFVVLVLALEVIIVALGVAWVVFNLITRPIKGISDELHRLEVKTGVRLRVPRRNQQDEIGRLVTDVNTLIGKLTSLLDTEHRMHMERQASERRLALIFEKVDAGIFEVESDGRLQSWNPAFERVLGHPPVPPQLPAMMGDQAQRLGALIKDSLVAGAPRDADLELQTNEGGGSKWVEVSLTPVSDHLLQGFINDITERKHAERDARRLAERDPLTGLFNRRGLEIGLEEALLRQKNEPGLVLVIMQVDLDLFKQVNDTYGHEAGDVVLRHVAAILSKTVRRTDLVARPGGDEFTIVLVGADSASKPEAIARHIIEELGCRIDIGNGRTAQIGASIGIAFLRGDDESPREALRRSDEAMYAAKQAGRNTFRVAPPPAESRVVEIAGAARSRG